MKWFYLLILLLLPLSSFAQKDESFFFVNFSKCQEDFVHFTRATTIDVNPREKYSLVCTDKGKFVECKMLDEGGKPYKEDKMKKSLNIPGISIFRGENGMEVMVMKATGGVLFSQTSVQDLQSVSHLVCRGEIKDTSDLKSLERSKELLGPKDQKVVLPKAPPKNPQKDDRPQMIGD